MASLLLLTLLPIDHVLQLSVKPHINNQYLSSIPQSKAANQRIFNESVLNYFDFYMNPIGCSKGHEYIYPSLNNSSHGSLV